MLQTQGKRKKEKRVLKNIEKSLICIEGHMSCKKNSYEIV